MSSPIWVAVGAGTVTAVAFVRLLRPRAIAPGIDVESVSHQRVDDHHIEPGDSDCSEIAMPEETLLERIRAEYLEMPGLRLKLEQAQHLCGVEPALCRRVFEMLVDMKFLCLKSDGAYTRLTDGPDYPRPRPAKADLESSVQCRLTFSTDHS